MSDHQLPEARAVVRAPGTSCANLTPLIKERLDPLQPGELLEVWSDDPAAREGVPAWSRLTGHPLVQVVEEDAGSTRFFLQHK